MEHVNGWPIHGLPTAPSSIWLQLALLCPCLITVGICLCISSFCRIPTVAGVFRDPRLAGGRVLNHFHLITLEKKSQRDAKGGKWKLSTGCILTRSRLGGRFPHPPRFFRNNSWTLADIDMKLGMTLRTSMLRRLVKEKSDSCNFFLDITDFVTSPPAILVRKKINVWKFVKNTFVKRIVRNLHKR